MNEAALIRTIARWSATTPGGDLIEGVGDDCAILRPRRNEDLLLTTDLMVEDVHFRRDTHPPAAIGWKCLARGISDIAAMGGEPRFALFSLVLPPWFGTAQLRGFYRGARGLAGGLGVRIIGGDITRGEKLVCDVVVIGSVPRGRALRRSGAKSGDGIYVSGPLGAAAASNWKTKAQPRIGLGVELRRRHRASACMDLSDGLSTDLPRMMLASGFAAELRSGSIPLAKGASLEQALHGGEDYELLFTLPPTAQRDPESGFTLIGFVLDGPPGRVRLDGKTLKPGGWDPFRRR
ncbi:MAG: thiamine-phosphate kinase [Bryobacteraceae bacterium]|nr:thiamine-phosphate kinase [Solibacteraceae bacterium]MCO5352848.1 thiamine-phosphate kinase [Bryobacteraceae bacterium]